MRAYSWIVLGGLALACGGSAFSPNDAGGEGGSGDDDDGGKAGVLGKAGRASGGSLIGSGGKLGSGGTGTGGGISVGGFGIAGDLVTGGTLPMGGEPGTAGMGPDPDPIDEVCPKDVPDVSRGCADGLTCSYGTDVRSSCRTRVKCQQGTWTAYPTDCPTLHACPNIVQGSECNATTAVPCTIEAHVYCVCTGCGAGGPCSNETVWKCSAGSGPQACPKLIPNEGQPCASNASCPYGSCVTDDGPVTATCNGASWGWATGICPQ